MKKYLSHLEKAYNAGRVSPRIQKLVSLLPFLLILGLPLLIIAPHLAETFVGPDFNFAFYLQGDALSSFYVWKDAYLGDRMLTTNNITSTLLTVMSLTVGGMKYAPQLYVYVVLSGYLAALYFLVVQVSALWKVPYTQSRATASALLCFAFFSPVVLGYLVNYFTISILFASIFALLSLGCIVRFFTHEKWSNLLVAALLAVLISHAPTALFFVGSVVLLLLFLGKIRAALLYLGIFCGAGMFWIGSMLLSQITAGGFSMSADTGYTTHIFSWYTNAVSVFSNLIYSIYPNNRLFEIIPTAFYGIAFTALYGIMFYVLITRRKHIAQHTKGMQLLYATLLVCLVGISFSFGGKYATGGIFLYLWEHVSMLHLFKSFTQVLNVVFVFFLVVLASVYAVASGKVRMILYGVSGALVIAVLLSMPTLHQFMYRGTIPQEYQEARNIIAQDVEESRILNLPGMAYQFYTWNGIWEYNTLVQSWFTKPVTYFSYTTPTYSGQIQPSNNDYTSFAVLNNFRYVLIHHDYNTEKYKPWDFEFSADVADVVMHNEYFDLLRIRDEFFTPRIYARDANVTFARKSPVRYQVLALGIGEETVLTQLDAYDKGWKLAPAQLTGNCLAQNAVAYPFDMALRTPLADASHAMVYEYANAWTLDASRIVEGYSPEYYKKNVDGTIDMCLTLYYRPQAYFYGMLFMSVFATIVTLGAVYRLRIKYE